MKVHRVTLIVVDTDDLGALDVKEVLEETKYPNHCIGPSVMQVDTVEVEWSDDHPLNHRDTMRAEFERLFTKDGGS